MSIPSRYFVVLALIILFAGCKQKKKPSLAGEEPVEVSDFIEFFEPLKLPYQADDTLFRKKENDSLLISYKVLTQFVPDSFVSKTFGKNNKPKSYAVGRITTPEKLNYILVKMISTSKKMLMLMTFNKQNNFIAGMPVLQPDQLSATSQSISIDRKFAIIKTITRKNPDGSISEGKDVYALDAASGTFSLVMTDPLEDKTELINPIDTLPRTFKYSADYSSSKTNLVSVRDGRSPGKIRFFIHFEKNNGDCTGELKGDAYFIKPNIAEYRQGGDPCVLHLIFSSSAVTLKEIEGCGSRRGLECSFNASFAKKKNPKPAVATRQAKKK
ncbi:MAG TPA: hypothetical protein PKC72_11245 [Chitinophagaceae bacterium]|nr:hypothetical protein [Chitinophagaceae bacterium]